MDCGREGEREEQGNELPSIDSTLDKLLPGQNGDSFRGCHSPGVIGGGGGG